MRLRASFSSCPFRLALSVACLSLVAVAQQPAQTPEPPAAKKNARPAGEAAAQAEPFDKLTPEQMSGRCVTLETEAGDIQIEVLAEAAPESARNFLNLVSLGAFDTTTFSRVVRGFVVQGGNLSTR